MTCSKKETCANYPQKCKACGMTSDIINHHPMYQNKDITKIISGAIEKQVARKPLDIPLEAWPHCPSCGGKLDDRENKNYCADCGQKLDWSDDE